MWWADPTRAWRPRRLRPGVTALALAAGVLGAAAATPSCAPAGRCLRVPPPERALWVVDRIEGPVAVACDALRCVDLPSAGLREGEALGHSGDAAALRARVSTALARLRPPAEAAQAETLR